MGFRNRKWNRVVSLVPKPNDKSSDNEPFYRTTDNRYNSKYESRMVDIIVKTN